MHDSSMEILRIAESFIYTIENRVDLNYTIYARDLASGTMETLSETHPMRHFSLPEMDLLAAYSSFKMIVAEEFLTGKPLGINTRSVCLVLVKNKKRKYNNEY